MSSSAVDGKDPERDKTFFFDYDFVVLQAENTLFRVPRDTLAHRSTQLSNLVALRDSSEAKPIVLQGVTADEFRHFFQLAHSMEENDVLWPKSLVLPETVDEWLAVLKLSTQWKCLDMRQRAIESINQIENFQLMDPIRRITLGRELYIVEWVWEGYHALVTRESSISDEEMVAIGATQAFRLERMKNMCSKTDNYDVMEGISREFRGEAFNMSLDLLNSDWSNTYIEIAASSFDFY